MAKQTDQAFESIRIVGGLLSTKVLQDARRYQLPGQSKNDYSIEPGLSFNEEIGRYWRIAQGRWKEYQQQSERQDISSHKLAQKEWLLPFLTRVLGYEIAPSSRKTIGEREFPITHTAHNGAVPLVLCGMDYDLDKGDAIFGQEGHKRSPMGLVQEYLNAEAACHWALVSNGTSLRLLRDNPAMTRPAYIEVDFARLFNEDNYADFAAVWLLLQASRLAPQNNQIEQCWLEQWRDKGQDEGERALHKLRYGVADALRQLGTGFVAHKDNQALRDKLSNGELTTDAYFQQVLRLVYRFLFMLTAEDRDVILLPKDYEGSDYNAARKLYQQGYSITQLRERARLNRHYDNHGDGWQQLIVTFDGFAKGQLLLAQPALGGLFADDQCEDLTSSALHNRYLFNALFNLCYFEHNHVLSRINYRDMDTEEFGSVYESLLELIPQLSTEGQWQFSFMGDAEDEESASGHSRKLTGSYYTPDSLVQELIKSALVPVIEDRLSASPQQPRDAILSITVCDPACGSGHFLLAAARRLATELARIDAGTDQPTEQHYRHALRDVVRHCIYGVDINPMAVELCKTGLWLESIEPGKPLSFLSPSIRTGSSLVGVLNHNSLAKSIPEKAYSPFTNDDKKVCAQLKKECRDSTGSTGTQFGLFSSGGVDSRFTIDIGYRSMPEDTVQQVAEKKAAWQRATLTKQVKAERIKEDTYTSSFFVIKNVESMDCIPTNETMSRLYSGMSISENMVENVEDVAARYSFFHWTLNFPDVFRGEDGDGFDVVLGNPPWDRIKFSEKEWFGTRLPHISESPTGAERAKKIALLQSVNPEIYREYQNALRVSECLGNYFRESGRFVDTGVGDVNTYALFSELISCIVNKNGMAGFIVPTGIVTDVSTKNFYRRIIENGILSQLLDFENREEIFKGVHRSYKFSLITLNNRGEGDSSNHQARYMFYLQNVREICREDKLIKLTKEDIFNINPGTRTCPVVRYPKDLSILKKMYSMSSVLEDSGWNSYYIRLVDLGDHKNEILPLNEYHQLRDTERHNFTGVYEAKLFNILDHRTATFSDVSEIDVKKGNARKVTTHEKLSKSFSVTPRYFVEKEFIEAIFTKYKSQEGWLISYRDICRATDERTCIPAAIPQRASTRSSPCVGIEAPNRHCFLANISTFCFDFAVRQKVPGTHLSWGIFKQLPFIPVSKYAETVWWDNTKTWEEWLRPKIIELVYVSEDIKPFADYLAFEGPPVEWDRSKRMILKSEIDAAYFYLYGLTRSDIEYILDTFEVSKNKEIKEFGEHLSKRFIIEAWDKLETGELN